MGECARRGSRVPFVAGDKTRTVISLFPQVTTDTYTNIIITGFNFTIQTPCEAPAEYMSSAIGDTSQYRRDERPSLPKPADAGQAK